MFTAWLNPMAQGWARWAVVSTVDATVVLAAVTVLWLACRRRLSAQFGYLLFLLVFVKLLVPVEIALPSHWAVSSPGDYTAQWLGMSRQSPASLASGKEGTKCEEGFLATPNDAASEPARPTVGQEGPTAALPTALASPDRRAGRSRPAPG